MRHIPIAIGEITSADTRRTTGCTRCSCEISFAKLFCTADGAVNCALRRSNLSFRHPTAARSANRQTPVSHAPTIQGISRSAWLAIHSSVLAIAGAANGASLTTLACRASYLGCHYRMRALCEVDYKLPLLHERSERRYAALIPALPSPRHIEQPPSREEGNGLSPHIAAQSPCSASRSAAASIPALPPLPNASS